MASDLETILGFAASQADVVAGVGLGYLGVPQAQAAAATAQANADAATAQAAAAVEVAAYAAQSAALAAQAEAAEQAGDLLYIEKVGGSAALVVGIAAAGLLLYVLVKR